MIDHAMLVRRLARQLAVETGDHPRIREAVNCNGAILKDVDWQAGGHVAANAISRFANSVEDWLGYEGVPLPDQIAANWASICAHAVIEFTK